MAEGFALADAFVRIRPTATGFRAEATAEIKSALAGISPEVNIGASTAAAVLKVAALKALLSDLARQVYAARITTDDAGLQAKLSRDYALLLKLNKTIASPEIDLLGAETAEAQMLAIAAGLQKINTTIATAHIAIDDADLERRLALLMVQLSALASRAYQVRVAANADDLVKVEALIKAIGELQTKVVSIDFSAIGLGQLTDAETQFKALNDQVGTMLPQSVDRARTSFNGLWGVLGRRVTLFGGLLGTSGLLGSIAVWHILADAIIETVAVLGPATLAFAAFAVAAADSSQNVVANVRSIMTVSAATGVSIGGLGGAFQRLEIAMAPKVYELFGDALNIINSRMGVFSQLATGAGNVVDQLGARIEQAITSASFSTLLAHAISDLSKIGDIVGNLFGIFGNLIKMISVWAQTLLEGVDIATRALENFTALPVVQTIGHWVIGVHGFWIWVGLLTSAVAGIIPVLARMLGVASETTLAATGLTRIKLAATDLGGAFAGIVPSIRAWGTRMVDAGLATGVFTGDVAAAGVGTKLLAGGLGVLVEEWPLLALAAGAALGYVIFRVLTAKTATEQWISSLQGVIDSSSWTTAVTTITSSLAKVNTALAASAAGTRAATTTTSAYGITVGDIGQNLTGAVQKQNDLTSAQRAFSDQLDIAGFRLGAMAHQFGGLTAAEGLAVLAGIKVNDLLHGSEAAFRADIAQIQGLIRGYQQMGVGAGALGNSVKVLEVTSNDQIAAVQKLTQAWSTFLGIVAGGNTDFITFAQNMLAVGHAVSQTGGNFRQVFTTFGDSTAALAASAQAARVASTQLGGLNNSSLQLQQTWSTAITSAQTYFNALQTQAAAASDAARGQMLLHQAGTDLIRILGPAATGSAILKQQIYVLAQQFGISASEMDKLITHTGSLKKNEQDLQDVNLKLAKSVSDVGKDWADMATTLQGQVKNALEAVALGTSGAAQHAEDLYKALHANNFAEAKAQYDDLVTSLHNSGLTWAQAKDYADAYTRGLHYNIAEILAGAGPRGDLQTDTTKQKILFQEIKVALDQYTTSIGKNSSTSSAGNAARAQLVTQIELAGEKAHLSSSQIYALIQNVTKLNNTQLKLIMKGDGSFSIQQVVSLSKPGGKLSGPQGAAGAAGMRVPGTGSRDTFPAMLMPGEAVVPKHLVPAVAPFLGAHRVPGFAAGGVAGGNFAGTLNAGTQWAAGLPGVFRTDMINSMESAMRSALASALKSAQQAAIIGVGASLGGSVASWVKAALSLAGAPASWFGALMRLVQLESGGNARAIDPILVDGQHATGLWQMLPSTFASYGGRGAGIFNPVAEGIAAIRYIRARYGSPYNIPGLLSGSYGGYDNGGYLPPGLSMAYNGTGRPEPVGVTAGQTVNINIKVDQAIASVTPDRQLGQQIGQHITQAIKGGMRLYPVGMAPR